MEYPFFTGTCTALITPFLGGQVNYPMMERLLQRQMDAGIHTVVLCGTTGESPTLTDTEKLTLFHLEADVLYSLNHLGFFPGSGEKILFYGKGPDSFVLDTKILDLYCVFTHIGLPLKWL